MKGIKTWEMLKEFTEGSKKKYRHDIQCGDYYIAEVTNEYVGKNEDVIYTRYESDGTKCSSLGATGRLSNEWTEVIEPVTFDVAKADCKATGQVYRRECTTIESQGVTMDRLNGIVYLNGGIGKNLALDGEGVMWIKVVD